MKQEIIERQRAAMAEAGMDALIALSPENSASGNLNLMRQIFVVAGLSKAGVPTETTLYD